MICLLCKCIGRFRNDAVYLGHNLFIIHLPYLRQMCKQYSCTNCNITKLKSSYIIVTDIHLLTIMTITIIISCCVAGKLDNVVCGQQVKFLNLHSNLCLISDLCANDCMIPVQKTWCVYVCVRCVCCGVKCDCFCRCIA